jgi:hypothetical protein
VSEKYNETIDLVARGTETYGKRLAACAGMDSFFLRRSKEEVEGMFPPTEEVRGPGERGAGCGEERWARRSSRQRCLGCTA